MELGDVLYTDQSIVFGLVFNYSSRIMMISNDSGALVLDRRDVK